MAEADSRAGKWIDLGEQGWALWVARFQAGGGGWSPERRSPWLMAKNRKGWQKGGGQARRQREMGVVPDLNTKAVVATALKVRQGAPVACVLSA